MKKLHGVSAARDWARRLLVAARKAALGYEREDRDGMMCAGAELVALFKERDERTKRSGPGLRGHRKPKLL